MIGIYKITNKINNKCYIGRSIDIEHRWRVHRTVANQPTNIQYDYPLYRAFRKYGVQNFSFEVVELCEESELAKKEQIYIALYRSNNSQNGYNQSEGGEFDGANRKFSEKDVQDLTIRLQTTNDRIVDIAEDYQVTEATIINFNKGLTYHRQAVHYPIRPPYEYHTPLNFCVDCGTVISKKSIRCVKCQTIQRRNCRQDNTNRPSPLVLAQQICETSFEAVGAKYGVSGNAIAKWCKSYRIPHTKEALKQWYCTQLNIEYIPPIKHTQTPKPKRQVKQIDSKTGEVLHIFPDMSSAKKTLNVTDSHISAVCLGKRKTAHGYKWEYIEN